MQDEDVGAWSAEYISRTIGAVTRLTGLSVCLYDLNRLRTLDGVKTSTGGMNRPSVRRCGCCPRGARPAYRAT